ncbi:MAG: hypothetical protein Q8L78_05010 [Coxiellaceae bacterium]|nr:hypothetical protein [Coxiellaceae bacterium]
MRRFIQCVSTVALLASASHSFANGFDYTKEDLADYSPENITKPADSDNPFARNGKAVYFFTGYMFAHAFWSGDTRTLTTGGGSVTYKPNQLFADNYNAFEVGVGKEVSRYIDFQFAYLQYLEKTTSTTIAGNHFSTQVKMNGGLGDIAFIFNPDSQFQVSAKIGVVIAQYAISAAVNGSSYYPADDSTKIEPALGMDFLYNIIPSTGIRTGILYIADVQNSASYGTLLGTIGVNYTL